MRLGNFKRGKKKYTTTIFQQMRILENDAKEVRKHMLYKDFICSLMREYKTTRVFNWQTKKSSYTFLE
jgi:hypothetical protein